MEGKGSNDNMTKKRAKLRGKYVVPEMRWRKTEGY